ncbi:MAG: hypothetical protein R6V75_04205, partial [Bacteroidales bacterium]
GSLATAMVSPEVEAWVGGKITANALSITANLARPGSGYSAAAAATGSAGGLIGVDATGAVATHTGTTKSYVAEESTLHIAGSTNVGANNNTRQRAEANSNTGGLIAAGISKSSASSNTTTEAYLGSNAKLTGGSLSVTATGTDENFAETTSGSIGLAGVASASAETSTLSETRAEVRSGALIHVSGEHGFGSPDVNTETDWIDLGVGHGLKTGDQVYYNSGGGDSVAYEKEIASLTLEDPETRTFYLGDGKTYYVIVDDSSTGLVRLAESAAEANLGEHLNLTDAGSGSGRSLIKPVSGSFRAAADHTAEPNSKVRSLAGGLFGGAGAAADNMIVSDVQAIIGENVVIEAKTLTVEAVNQVNKPMIDGGSIRGEAGGLIAGGGADSDTIITLTTLVTIGDGARLDAKSDAVTPGDLTLRALNNIVANEKVVLFAAGGLSGLFGNASIKAETDLAGVQIGDADLTSAGDMNISARGQGNVVVLVNAEAYGAGTLVTGTAEGVLRPTNVIDIATGAHLAARGDLNLSAGTDTNFARDQYSMEVRHDSFAGSAIPLDDVDAGAFLIQHNTINIHAGALLETARSAYLHTERLGLADMLAKAKAVNWVSSLTDAIGGASEYQYKGTSNAESHAIVQMDGTVRTGIERHQSLELTGWDPESGVITASGTVQEGDVKIPFRVTQEPLESDLVRDLSRARDSLALYEDTNETLANYYRGEIARLEGLLASQGLLNYAVITIEDHGFSHGDAVVYNSTGQAVNGLEKGATYYVIRQDDDTLSLAASADDVGQDEGRGHRISMNPSGAAITHTLTKSGESAKSFVLNDLGGAGWVEQHVMTVHVAPVWAEAGLIDVRADVLQGTGVFDAPSDVSVTILNHTPAFLVVHGITIPERNGGLYFTGDPITDNDNIITRNNFNIALDEIAPPSGEICGHWDAGLGPVAFSALPNPAESEPGIVVNNDFVAGSYPPYFYPWPDIKVVGDIDNLGGDVLLTTLPSGEGDVLIEARIRAKNLVIVSGGALYIDGVTEFAVGGEPYRKYEEATKGSITSTYDHDNNPNTPDISVTASYPGIKEATEAAAAAVANKGFADEATVYADKIFINAAYININGLIQSGKADYNLILGDAIAAEIS